MRLLEIIIKILYQIMPLFRKGKRKQDYKFLLEQKEQKISEYIKEIDQNDLLSIREKDEYKSILRQTNDYDTIKGIKIFIAMRRMSLI